MTKLADIKTEWKKYIVLKDERAVDIMLATTIGNMLLDKDPIWTMVIAPSSGGKTTLLAPITDIPKVYFVDDLTEKTLLSGYKVKGQNQSLLTTIGSGIMAFSDFTSILSKNHVSRGEILSQLKLVYDRKVSKYTGTGGVKWEGKIGFVGCATPDIYYHLESGRSMGERFIYYWLDVPTDEEITLKQRETSISAHEMTNIMKEFYARYYDGVKQWTEKYPNISLKMSNEQEERVRKASIFCVSGKATVHTNYKSGKVDQIPMKASVGRDFKAFEALLLTFQVMFSYETNNPDVEIQDWMIDIVEKCAYSSINRERRAILEIIADSEEELTASQIGTSKGLGLEKEGVNIYLNPLFAVGLIKRNTKSNAFKWYMEDGEIKDFINKVANAVPQIKLKEEEEEQPPDEDEIEIEIEAEKEWELW